MIKILGARRIIILAVLIGLNALLAYAAYMYLIPQKTQKERELRGARGQVSSLQADIDDLQIEFEQLDEQREEFERLKAGGFFDVQSRRNAELIFKQIQDRSGVISAAASVAAGEFEEYEPAKKADHNILKSPITIRIEAVNDLDVYRYMYLIEEFFPGSVSFDEINLRRNGDVSGTVVRGISSGQNPSLVLADLTLSWRTMIPIEKEQGGDNE